MPISLVFSLCATLLYIAISFNKEVYNALYIKYLKIDVLLSVMLCAWMYYIFDTYFGVIYGASVGILIFLVSTFLQYAVYRSNKIKNEENVNTNTNTTVSNNSTGSPMDMFNGKRGKIKNHVSGFYYLGDINTGTEENPIMQDILLYNKDGFKLGDTYEITHVEGSNIVAKRV